MLEGFRANSLHVLAGDHMVDTDEGEPLTLVACQGRLIKRVIALDDPDTVSHGVPFFGTVMTAQDGT